MTGIESGRLELNAEDARWLKEQLKAAAGRPVILAMHTPFLVEKSRKCLPELFAQQLFPLLEGHRLEAIITGHRHRNDEYQINGVNQIQSGSLLGGQVTSPPHYWLSVYPGYRLFYWDGARLHSMWRELWADVQVALESIGGVHTLGPRPMVRPAIVSGETELFVKAYAADDEVTEAAYSVRDGEWIRLRRTSDRMWSEWKGMLHAGRLVPGPYVVAVYARTASGKEAYDTAPIVIGRGKNRGAAGGPEITCNLFTVSENEAKCFSYDRRTGIHWRINPAFLSRQVRK